MSNVSVAVNNSSNDENNTGVRYFDDFSELEQGEIGRSSAMNQSNQQELSLETSTGQKRITEILSANERNKNSIRRNTKPRRARNKQADENSDIKVK